MYYNFKSKEGYGINTCGEWRSIWKNNGYIERNNLIKATDQEVEEALIKEAKRRYKVGDCIIPFNLQHISKDTLNVNIHKNNFYSICYISGISIWVGCGKYNGLIFRDGKWAEIIEAITIEQAEKELGKKIIK